MSEYKSYNIAMAERSDQALCLVKQMAFDAFAHLTNLA